MSQQLINRNSDLRRLRDEGFGVQIKNGYLLIDRVPYVNAKKEVKLGTLVSELTLALGDVTTTPSTHVAYFVGEYPCDENGVAQSKILLSNDKQQLGNDLQIDHSFSAKPTKGGYVDYYEKIVTYVALISSPAQKISPEATAQYFPWSLEDEEDSVFVYADTASSRANISLVSTKLEIGKVAVIGLGGTGSYILDLIAKTPIKEIHLFDKDDFLQHNAFRSPGAPTLDLPGKVSKKVAYFAEIYSRMRRGIIPHPFFVDSSNVDGLSEMDFVFLCMDAGRSKKVIVQSLEEFGIPFIDVGLGVDMVGDSLRGVVRVTSSTEQQRKHLQSRVSLSDVMVNAEYDTNIQIADLNALNAALAVIKWKKFCGFYVDLENEHHSTYSIDVNMLLSEDSPCMET